MNLTEALQTNFSSPSAAPSEPSASPSFGSSGSTGLADRLRASAGMPSAPAGGPSPSPSPYFQGKEPSGSFIGIGTSSDPFSGRPYLAYRTPGADATTTDYTRTAPLTNPEIAAPQPRSAFENPRMPESASQGIRAALGATPSQQLDHQLALAVGGSNNSANLKLIPASDNQAAAPLEGQLSSDVSSGTKSLFQAQNEEAKAKGLPPVWTDQQVQEAASPLGATKNFLGAAWGVVKDFAGQVLNHVYQGIVNPLSTAQGVVQTGVLKPVAFVQGITNGILTAEGNAIDKTMGFKPNPGLQPVNAAQVLIDANNSIDRTPQEKAAYDTGNFLGWMIPYGEVAKGAKLGLDALPLAPTVAKYIPAIADAAGFLGTGQILHEDSQGSRMNQLKNDAIALALFKVGGFALQRAGLYAARALGNLLPEGTAAKVADAMAPIYDAFSNNKPVEASAFADAVDAGKQAVVEDTGMTPKQILQDHIIGEQAPPETAPAAAGEPPPAEAAAATETAQPTLNPKVRTAPQLPIDAGPDVSFNSSATDYLKAKGISEDNVLVKNDAQRIVENSAGNDAVLTDVSVNSFGNPQFETLNQHTYKPGRAIKEPIEATLSSDGSLTITDGANRFTQAKANGDATIPVALEVEGKNGAPLEGNKLVQWKEANGAAQNKVEPAPGTTATPRIGSQLSIQLPEIPVKPKPILGVVFPGADTVATFVNKDIIDKFPAVVDNLKGVVDATKELLAGPSPTQEKAEAMTAATIQSLEQAKSAAWAVAEDRRDWWAKLPESVHLDFLDKAEQGAITPADFAASGVSEDTAKAYSQLAVDFRDRLNAAFEGEQDAGVREGYINDYFPHYWTEPDQVQTYFDNYAKSLGKGRFTKLRTIDLIKQGLDAGFKLQTTNPEELVLLRELDGMRITAKIDLMKNLAGEGLAIPAKEAAAEGIKGMSAYDAPDGTRYLVVPEAAKVLNNAFFEENLWSNKGALGTAFRSLMTLKGTFVPLKLSLSLFHPIHIGFIAASSDRAIVWENVIKGNMDGEEALAALGKASSGIGQLEAGAQYGWGESGPAGLLQADVVKWWNTPMEQLNDSQRQVVQYIIDGGGSPAMSEEYLVRARDGFKKALQDENYIGAAIRGVPKLVEAYQKPVFESYIPALKISSYMNGVQQLLEANPELATDDVARQVAFRKLWQSMDNRFGQMVYSTLFWNPIVKQTMEASFLSLGWNLGFVREFGGGAFDLGKLATKLSVGNAAEAVSNLPLGPIAEAAGNLAESIGQATKDDITQRMLFMLDYNIQAGLVGGLMTYAMTGKLPSTVQDLFFPNTGQTNPDGSPARLNTSFYTREYFALANHWQKQGAVGGTLATVSNKMNPVLASLAQLYQNKDYYGYQIRDTTSPVATQAGQVLSYLLGNDVSPISITGAQTASKTTGPLGALAAFAGFGPAPKYITETPIQSQIYGILDERTGGTKPLESKAQQDAKSNIRTLYLKGDIAGANTALEKAVSDGYISQNGVSQFVSSLDLPADVRAFQSLAQFPSDQEHLLSKMTEEELARYAPYASAKVRPIISTLSPTAKKFVEDLNSGKIHGQTFKAAKPVEDQSQQ